MGQVPEPGPGFAHGSLWLFPAPQKASEGQDLEPDGRQEEEDMGDTHHVKCGSWRSPTGPEVPRVLDTARRRVDKPVQPHRDVLGRGGN